MKIKFTYKEFTLLAGILVALIVMLTLWLNPADGETGEVSKKLIPAVGKPSAKAVVEKTFVIFKNFAH